MTRAYLSSTYSDLREFRTAARRALGRQVVDVLAMEDYVADDSRPLEKCLADVAKCDLYIGIFAWRYGHIPAGQDRSITEAEYREAVRLNIPRLVFLLADDAPWSRTLMDLGPEAGRIETLRADLKENCTVSFFTNPVDLENVIAPAIAVWSRERSEAPPVSPLSDAHLTIYYDRLVREYGGLDLDSLTPPRTEEYLEVKLTSVFVEPHVRADPPPAELPREWLERLRNRGELELDDVPELVDVAELDSLRQSYRAKPLQRLFEVIASPTRRATVVLGDPGSGKSTVARYLALSLADGRVGRLPPDLANHVPILIELRAYATLVAEEECSDFLGYLDHLSRHEGLGLERGALDRYLSSGGQALFIFDGLDEVFDQRARTAIIRRIVEFRARHPGIRVVVTSRVVGYSRRIFTEAKFEHYTLQDLDQGQIDEFLRRWYPGSSADRPETGDVHRVRNRLVEAMRQSPALRELAGNPLLLTVLVIIGRHRALPRDRRALYDHATTVLVENWDVHRQLGRPGQTDYIDLEDKKALLRQLAFHMQSSGRALSANYIEQADLRKVFEDYLRWRHRTPVREARSLAGAMINQFRSRNFILSRYGSDIYGFVHRTFLEYFCAEAIVAKFQHDQQWRMAQIRRQYRDHWADPSWREVLRLVAGSLHERHNADVTRLLVDEVNTDWPPGEFTVLPWNLALAVQCLGEARTLHEDLAAPAEAVLKKLILLLEHSVGRHDPDLAALLTEEILPAARTIGPRWPGRQRYLKWYRRRGVHLVWSPTMSLAAQLAAILATPADHLEDLFDGELAQIGDNRAAYAAVAGLADLAGSQAADSPARALLIRRVCQDDHNLVRLAAVQALGERFRIDAELAAVLIERATVDGSANVRQAAVRALGERHEPSPDMRALLTDRLTADPAATVRREAVRLLARSFAADPSVHQLVHGALEDDRDADVIVAAANALADQFDARDEVGRPLMRRAVEDEEGSVRRAAVRLLGERWADEPDVVRLLLDRLTDEEDAPALREAARCFLARALEQHRSTALTRLIARLADDPNGDIRRVAVQALCEQFQDDAETRAAALRTVTSDSDAEVRLVAVTALVRWAPQDTAILTALESRALDDLDRTVRSAALNGLVAARWDGAGARALLSRVVVEDTDASLREQAVRVLAERHGGNSEAQRLIAERCRNDRNREVRLAAVHALAELDDVVETVHETLIGRVLDEKSGSVFACAAEAVTDWLSSDSAGQAVLIRRAGHDSNAHVRSAAARLLGGLYPDDAGVLEFLVGLAGTDLDAAVVEAAATALADACAGDEIAAADHVAVLVERAQGDDASVRRAAMWVLGERYAFMPGTFSTLLRAARLDDNQLVRREALTLLVRYFTHRKDVRKTLNESLADADFSVREAAVRLLADFFGTERSTWLQLARLAENTADPQLSLVAGQTLSWLPQADPDRMPSLRRPG
ncbi:HEAT repeat domain-containing protein [Paractinoplanes hotanensis]|uniref:HEAT repeat domain-containing protein n=1 Tax=Paractinoplanes hotanensis TaxID=2906497 RepID=A0ABT0YDR2_9ACTN|nr:HEAT repeat domain-containing protein [Actinoplanes hotanensis]MCM4084193.1 HEAT repeat domain-containing protein [Actinoplanes hotanensis]